MSEYRVLIATIGQMKQERDNGWVCSLEKRNREEQYILHDLFISPQKLQSRRRFAMVISLSMASRLLHSRIGTSVISLCSGESQIV